MSSSENNNGCIICHKNFIIDLRYRTVTIFNHSVELCPKEFATLSLLAKHLGWVFTKEQIYEEVYKNALSIDIDNIVYCLIYGLRKKIEPNPRYPKYIRTVKGVGYKFIISEE